MYENIGCWVHGAGFLEIVEKPLVPSPQSLVPGYFFMYSYEVLEMVYKNQTKNILSLQTNLVMVDVAQLVRALDCGSRGRRFKSGLPPKKKPAGCGLF